MQWTQVLLILIGQCSLFSCLLYEFHFINEEKTWDEAQKFCRENYTDLATVSNMTDMKRLWNSEQNQDEAWIGLHSYPGKDNRKWFWSLPGLEFDESQTKWKQDEPNDARGVLENCGMVLNKQWCDAPCNSSYPFICYNESNQSTFHYIDTLLTWTQAQNYCREHYTDLVSGVDQFNTTVNSNMYRRDYIWIGLFRDTWRWSDGSKSSFRNWEYVDDLVDGQSKKTCATVMNRTGKWSLDKCDEKKSFYCYEDKLILIKERKTWVEALNYCRENHHDLVSITNPEDQRWVQERVKNASTHVWLGLKYTCTLGFWFWVSDESVSFQNWASDRTSDDCDMSAAMETGGDKWFKKHDNEKFNFICSKF